MSTINPRKTFHNKEKVSVEPDSFPTPAANPTGSFKHSAHQL